MKLLGTSLTMVLGLFVAQAAMAGDDCCGAPEHCGRCGHHAACQKYCKVVPDVKEVKKTVWVVKCEDFCAPLPALPCRNHSAGGAEGCDNGCPSCAGGPCARCGCVRTKKILEKKEVTEQVPCWKCVVVYACPGCCDGCSAEGMTPVQAGDAVPAAPLPPGPTRALPPPPPKAK